MHAFWQLCAEFVQENVEESMRAFVVGRVSERKLFAPVV